MRAMQALDHAHMSTHIARQARMGARMDVSGANAVAELEQRGRLRRPAVRPASQGRLDIGDGERTALQCLARAQRARRRDLVGVDEAALKEQASSRRNHFL